jgi:hypothetical protein
LCVGDTSPVASFCGNLAWLVTQDAVPVIDSLLLPSVLSLSKSAPPSPFGLLSVALCPAPLVPHLFVAEFAKALKLQHAVLFERTHSCVHAATEGWCVGLVVVILVLLVAVLCCAVLCCAVLCCAVLCCAVLCCAVLCCAVLLCCALWCVMQCVPRAPLTLRLPCRWSLNARQANTFLAVARVNLQQASSSSGSGSGSSSRAAAAAATAATGPLLSTVVHCVDGDEWMLSSEPLPSSTPYVLLTAPISFDMEDDVDCTGISPSLSPVRQSGVAVAFLVPAASTTADAVGTALRRVRGLWCRDCLRIIVSACLRATNINHAAVTFMSMSVVVSCLCCVQLSDAFSRTPPHVASRLNAAVTASVRPPHAGDDDIHLDLSRFVFDAMPEDFRAGSHAEVFGCVCACSSCAHSKLWAFVPIARLLVALAASCWTAEWGPPTDGRVAG